MAEKNYFKDQDITNLDFPVESESRFGSEYLRSVKEFQVGTGSTVFRADKSGIWLGASNFADAPFSVNMKGEIKATGITLSSLSGTLDDISNGVTYKKATLEQVVGGGYAYSGLNNAGEIIKGFLNTQLSSKTLPVNGVCVDSNGIYGRKAGNTTFYINSTGDAYFSGSIVSSSLTSSTITGGTITGSLFKTQSSGQRIELQSTLSAYYDEYGSAIAQSYAYSSSFWIKSSQSSGSIIVQGGTSTGSVYLKAGSSSSVLLSYNGMSHNVGNTGSYIWSVDGSTVLNLYYNGLVPQGSMVLGSSGNPWLGVYASSFTLNGTTIYSWPSGGSTLSALSIDTNKNWNSYSITNVYEIYANMFRATGSAPQVGTSGTPFSYMFTNSLRLTNYYATNPSTSGEIRFYSSSYSGFRGNVEGWRGQFDMTGV